MSTVIEPGQVVTWQVMEFDYNLRKVVGRTKHGLLVKKVTHVSAIQEYVNQELGIGLVETDDERREWVNFSDLHPHLEHNWVKRRDSEDYEICDVCLTIKGQPEQAGLRVEASIAIRKENKE